MTHLVDQPLRGFPSVVSLQTPGAADGVTGHLAPGVLVRTRERSPASGKFEEDEDGCWVLAPAEPVLRADRGFEVVIAPERAGATSFERTSPAAVAIVWLGAHPGAGALAAIRLPQKARARAVKVDPPQPLSPAGREPGATGPWGQVGGFLPPGYAELPTMEWLQRAGATVEPQGEKTSRGAPSGSPDDITAAPDAVSGSRFQILCRLVPYC